MQQGKLFIMADMGRHYSMGVNQDLLKTCIVLSSSCQYAVIVNIQARWREPLHQNGNKPAKSARRSGVLWRQVYQ